MKLAGLLAVQLLTYASNPLRDPAPALLTPALEPATTLSAPSLRALSCVDHDDVREVRACTLEQIAAPPFDATPHPATVDAAPDPAAEASAFYHAAKMRAFFEGLAGHALPNVVDVVAGLRVPGALLDGDRQAAALPSATLDPLAASFYLRAGQIPDFDRIYGTTHGTVWLGRGSTRDLAYDGDLIAHEMTHAMLDGVLHAAGFRTGKLGASVEPEAMSEALADYFAAAATEDPILNEWVSAEPGAESGYRDLTTFASCPSAIDGLSHDESLMLSGALWSARAALDPVARSAFDAKVYRAVAALPARADVGFADLASALGDASVTSELQRRSVGCDPILTLTGPLRASGLGFYAPAGLPGVVQLEVALPAGTTSVTVEFTPIAVAPPLFSPAAAPFAPAVAASFDAPIVWPGTPLTVDAPGVIARSVIPVPNGAHVAYLQVVNRGASDGLYNYVTVTPTADATLPEPLQASGSGCTVTRESGGDAALMAAIALTALRSRGGKRRRRSSAATSSSTSR